ncbi:hypothetical protein LCGC14_3030640, partial [marine sediment metagenome]
MKNLNNSIKKLLTKSFLIKEYIKNDKSVVKIATEIKPSETTIYKYLKIHNIKMRTMSEALKKYQNFNKTMVYREYITNKNTALQIAKKIQCSDTTVYRYLKKYNILRRTKSEVMKGKN